MVGSSTRGARMVKALAQGVLGSLAKALAQGVLGR